MLKSCGRSVKWKELAVNRTSLVMIKRRANTFFISPTAFWSGILLFVRETGFASRLPRAPGARSAAQEPRRTQLFFRGYIELMPLIGYLQARGFGNLFATRVPADYLYHTPGRILRGVTLSFWRTDVGE